MSATDKNNDKVSTDICANCGKSEEASINLKSCTACKLVKYCGRDCQIAHRPQHKKECKQRAAELHDEKLFKQPQPLEDCPICMILLPRLATGRTYMACCGKFICRGCMCAPVYDHEGNVVADTCPFCRTPPPSDEEEVLKRYNKRAELNDAGAIYSMASFHAQAQFGLPPNAAKALELLQRAGELGFASAYHNIGNAFHSARGVNRDGKKADYYYELAAIGGDPYARHNLGLYEYRAGNFNRALKHWMIALRDGVSDSLRNIKSMYMDGHATKDDYATALRSHQAYLDEIKSEQRDEAAAFSVHNKYFGCCLEEEEYEELI